MPVALLAASLTYAAIDHGGFYPHGFRAAVLLAFAAAAAALLQTPLSRAHLSAPLVGIIALAAWYAVDSLAVHDLPAGLASLEMLAALAAVMLAVAALYRAEREVLLWAVIGAGLIVAVSAWIGFVWRKPPLAVPDVCCGVVWRAASTITYANAAGAVLTACALVGLGLIARSSGTALLRLAVYLILVGLATTLSRGAFIALAVGLVVLVGLDGTRALRGWPVFAGAAVAFATLLPALHVTQPTRPALACCGLVVGAAIAVVPVRAVALIALAVLVVGLAAPGVRAQVRTGWRAVAEGRFNATSTDRSNALDAAFRLIREHPVAGVGPGRVDLTWSGPDAAAVGELHLAYAHDEYVQVLAEAGAIGAVLLGAGLIATAIALWRRRRNPACPTGAGCIAAVVAIGVHSASDFLWHIPIVPLIAAILVATVVAPEPPPPPLGAS